VGSADAEVGLSHPNVRENRSWPVGSSGTVGFGSGAATHCRGVAVTPDKPEYTYTATLPLRLVLEEIRRMNAGKERKAYLRFRVHLFTYHYRRLLEGKEKALSVVAVNTAQRFGGRVVRVGFTPISVEIDYLCPVEVGCEKANRLLARAMSDHFKQNFKGIGGAESNGFLWQKYLVTYSMDSPMLERPREFETL